MNRIMLDDFGKIIRSWRFWTMVGIMIVSTAITLITTPFFTYVARPFGGVNLFVYGNVTGNSLASSLAPFIPALIVGPLVVAGREREAVEAAQGKTGLKKYIAARSVSSFVAGSGVFIVSFLIILAACLIIDPTNKMIDYPLLGPFKELRYVNTPLYITLFILHTALFGGVYALLSMGIGLKTKNAAMALVLPAVVYFGSGILYIMLKSTIFSWLTYILPDTTYDFGAADYQAWEKILELGSIFLLSVILIVSEYFKLKKETAILREVKGNEEKENEKGF